MNIFWYIVVVELVEEREERKVEGRTVEEEGRCREKGRML